MISGYMAGAAAESPGSNAAGEGVTYALETVSSTRPLTLATVSRARTRSQFGLIHRSSMTFAGYRWEAKTQGHRTC
jgi:hypothetical protein